MKMHGQERRSFRPVDRSGEIAADLTRDVTTMIEALAIGIAVSEDQQLCSSLSPGRSRFSVLLPGGAAIEIGADAPYRLLQENDAVDLDLGVRLAASGELRTSIGNAMDRRNAFRRAEVMLEPWLSTIRLPSRRDGMLVDVWAPVVERLAYRTAARACLLIDRRWPPGSTIRPDAARSREARGRWALLSVEARMTLLATRAAGAEWLVDMSRSFHWSTWTPSLPLLRERSLWLGMIAARSAACFGPRVLQDYEVVLRTTDRPFRLLDAAVGMIAIGLRHPETAGAVEEAILSRIDGLRHRTSLEALLALRSAVATLRDPASGTRTIRSLMGWAEDGGSGYANRRALLADPGGFTHDGGCLGVLAVPLAVGSAIETFFPSAATAKLRKPLWLSDDELLPFVSRAADETTLH